MEQILIKTMRGTDDLGDSHAIRSAVFQQEQGIDPALDFDVIDRDAATLHKTAYLNGEPVATVRVVFPIVGKAKVGRLCVLASHRGKGLGRMLMEELMEDLPTQGVEVVELSSQASAQGLYTKLGFATDGDVYEEAGLPHVKMIKHFVK